MYSIGTHSSPVPEDHAIAGAEPGYLAERNGGLLRITVNTPDQGNPIPAAAVLPLTARFKAALDDASIRCILVRGAGRHLSTGGNVAGFFQELAHRPDHLAATFRDRLTLTIDRAKSARRFAHSLGDDDGGDGELETDLDTPPWDEPEAEAA